MISKIDTTTTATGLDNIDENWKVIARRHLRTISGEIAAIWEYSGTLSDSKENLAFRKLAFSAGRKEQPHISCVTGRDALGVLCLYARIYPTHLRPTRNRVGYA